jgi:hypothetical protein
MTESQIHVLSRLLLERTGLVAAGSMAVRAAIELMLQKGYRVIPPAEPLVCGNEAAP